MDDDPVPVRAAAAQMVGSTHLKLTLLEGKYHQVKRMFAAVGNRVTGLHREAIGAIRLDTNLPEGSYRHLTSDEIQSIYL